MSQWYSPRLCKFRKVKFGFGMQGVQFATSTTAENQNVVK
jgi:hypothetical protein